MTTPMFRQYKALKAQNPDALMLFRMGDFYEVFFQDAEVAAAALDLTLTTRNKDDPDPIPMAGFPHHAASSYIQRLVEAGHRVAIADQVEDPAKAKGLVRREVVRVVTPGVVLDPTQLAGQAHNWLAAVHHTNQGYGLAFLDASTGDLRVTEVGQLALAEAELQRFEPREALISPGVPLAELSATLRGVVVSSVELEAWRPEEARREVREVTGADPSGFGVEPGPGLQAAGAAIRYVRDRLGGQLNNLHRLTPYRPDGFMVIDRTSRRNLELTRTLMGGKRRGSLLALLDRAATHMGSRLIEEWLVLPLLQVSAIQARQAAVEDLVQDMGARQDLRAALKRVADVERIGARVAQGSAHARDLAGLARSLEAAPEVARLARQQSALKALAPTDLCEDTREDLRTWLLEEPPISLTEGGLIRTGAHEELDALTKLSLEGVGIIGQMEEEERQATGITSLKIRRNRVFGYFIEVTKANLHRVPDRFLRKQTLSNCERYITAELKELEERVLGADERRKELEFELFVALRERVAAQSARLLALSRSLAQLDALSALAEVAVRHRWVRPVVNDSRELVIEGGRHPVVEQALVEERFVPNDVSLRPEVRQLVVLTGPNMSGKSTVMRQVALIALLAQMGSFVPASAATVGLCDRIFTRVGASDDLAKGQSTFMVEMAETSTILHHATDRSLVVLDEIGRGTSTYDGLAIAWAVAEDLADRVGCRALFATHYHELCELADTRPQVANQSVSVSEFQGEIIFLRRLKEGGASRSYGIQCARIAGLPAHVVTRAKGLLSTFEKHAPRNERQQLSLFSMGTPTAAAPAEEPAPVESAAMRALREIDPDDLSPRAAHAALYELKKLLQQST